MLDTVRECDPLKKKEKRQLITETNTQDVLILGISHQMEEVNLDGEKNLNLSDSPGRQGSKGRD